MELLLNLAWLLLALPAYWLWRECGRAPSRRRFSSLQCLLALACCLVILFPIVSATDDLRVMRAEMEDSPCSKRSICQRGADKSSVSGHQSRPALPVFVNVFFTSVQTSLILPISSMSIASCKAASPTGRAPPADSLA